MENKKINIVVLGTGKIGSSIVSGLINLQPAYLSSHIEVRISVIVNSSLLFLENTKQNNAWDVSILQSPKQDRIDNLVDYIAEQNFATTLIIDATNSLEIISYYPYFLQSDMDVITLNSKYWGIDPHLKDEIKISADVFGQSIYSVLPSLDQHAAVHQVLTSINEIAIKSPSNCRVKRAI